MSNEDVELDVDIEILFDCLFNQALKSIQNEVDKSIQYFSYCLAISPKNNLVFYNLSCCFALKKMVNESIRCLSKAVELGYSNLEHMLKDEDFSSIRNTKQFQDIVQKLSDFKKCK